MSPPDLKEILEQARQMQSRMEQVQRELARKRVEGSAGGGLVTAVATGDLRIAELRIDPQLLEGGDLAMLQDLVAAAVNAALGEAQRSASEELARVAGPLAGGLPGAGGAGQA